MYFKTVIACALVAVCAANIPYYHYHHHHPHAAVSSQSVYRHDQVPHHGRHTAPAHHEHSNPKYEFKYSVQDPHTGDHKSQYETRSGDVVKGEYSLLQPDGSFRKVTYVADPHSGFQAEVHNTAPVIHPHHQCV